MNGILRPFTTGGIWNLLVTWSSSSLSELEEWEGDKEEVELGDIFLRFFLLFFLLLFFLRLGGEQDWEEEDVWRRFLVFRFFAFPVLDYNLIR